MQEDIDSMENLEAPSAEYLEDEPPWKQAKHGIKLLLNNKQSEADNLFKKYPESIQMYCGYAISVFMDALMTFEEDKLLLANQVLRETERRCAGPAGWFRLGRTKESDLEISYAEHLESQIIRADAEMYLATLTFLQQDVSGYFKGGWILRKSWKHYLQTYNEILTLYKQLVGELPDENDGDCVDIVSSAIDVVPESEAAPSKDPPIEIYSDMEIFDKNELLHQSSSHSIGQPAVENEKDKVMRNGYNLPKSNTTFFQQEPPNTSLLRKSLSVPSALARFTQLGFSTINSNISYLTATLNPFNYFATTAKPVEMDKDTITRLMCAVSFGYGLLQLGMSLLPPNILRLTNFLGFQGNRHNGLKNLMLARCGVDMRAPLATLAILWYHTIVRPFFALDGNNVQAGVDISSKLIEKAMAEYSESSLFLFFKGRVSRLKCEIPEAIEAFNSSIALSNQREVKILGQHEVGWCYLIELNYAEAFKTFTYLKTQSRWSKCFYTYVSTISAGANGSIPALGNLSDVCGIFTSPTAKGTQLEEFLSRRFKICPSTEEAFLTRKESFWRLLVFEMLYLWNSMASCSFTNLNVIVKDCAEVSEDASSESFIGLANLLAGSALCILKDYSGAIVEFRNCLEARKCASFQADDAHVSAFALYELGSLLIKEPETKEEGKQCLQQVCSYKDYDFEQRLSVRIHSILKHL